jgi:RNA polymerase sigma factor (sigma-70 family)
VTTTAEQLDGTRALVQRWRAGDPAARDALLERLYPVVRRWARIHVSDGDEADDVAQQALITVYRKIHQFRATESLAPWVYRITARAAAQRRRTDVRRFRLGRADASRAEPARYLTDPGGRVDRERLGERIAALYRALPARQREVFALVDVEGHAPAEAAAMLALAPATLRANLFKARAALRRRLLAEAPALAERFARAALPADDHAEENADG